jgi:hypothetical protein
VSLVLPVPGPADATIARVRYALIPITGALYAVILARVRGGYWRRAPLRLLIEWALTAPSTRYFHQHVVTTPHELLHAAPLRLFTGARPLVLVTPDGYSYAAAPGWWLPRNQALVVLLLPVGALAALLLALVPIAPRPALAFLGWLTVRAVANSNADIYVSWRLLRRPAETYFHDDGSTFTFSEPAGRD